MLSFYSVLCTDKFATKRFNPHAQFLIVKNRGNSEGNGNILLSTEESDDTFVLQPEDPPLYFLGNISNIKYKSSEDYKDDEKIRLDLAAVLK